ncbi:MAG: flagellar biosynthetic protein FliR, partial [Rhodospirillaceae bacterium]
MLSDLLAANIFHFFLIFARVGATFLFLPPFATSYIPRNVRLIIAMGVTLAMLPMLSDIMPPVPTQPSILVALFALEILIGAFIGLMAQVFFSILSLAGTVIGFASGLMMAQTFDPATSNQGSLVASYLSELGVIMIFAMGLHVVFIMTIADSYMVFQPGDVPMVDDMAVIMVRALSEAFYVGWQLAAPFVIYSIVFHSMLGILSRLMPTMNVLFVAIPLQILLALMMLNLIMPFLLTIAMGRMETGMRMIFTGN